MRDCAESFVNSIVSQVENDYSVPAVFGIFRPLPGLVRAQIAAWQNDDSDIEIPEEVKWELLALDTMTLSRRRRAERRDNPLQPMAKSLLEDEKAIAYYIKRSQETVNPVRRARYAELVWMAFMNRSEPNYYQYAIYAAEAYLAQVPLCVEQERYSTLVDCLDRASEISVQLNNRELAARAVETATAHLSQLPEEHRHRWVLEIGDSLLCLRAKYADCVSNDVLIQVRQIAQNGIIYYAGAKPRNLHLISGLAELATTVSQSLGEPMGAWSCRVQAAELFEAEARERENATGPTGGGLAAYKLMEGALHEYQRLLSIAPNSGEKQRLRTKIEAIKVEIRRLMRLAESQMKTIEVQSEMPTDQLEKIVESLLQVEPAQIPRYLSYYPDMVPNIADLRRHADEMAGEFVFSSMMGMTMLRDGRKVDETPPMSGSATHFRTSLQIWFQVHFAVLDYVFQRLREEGLLSSESFVAHLRTWELLDESDVPFIETGLERYFAQDYTSSLHVLVTRIEHMLKSAFEQAGEPVVVVPNTTQIREQTLGDFLCRDDVRSALGEDTWYYFYCALVDENYLNLRNDVAHGWIQFHSCNRLMVQVVLFLILLLTRLQRKPEEDEKKHMPSDSLPT